MLLYWVSKPQVDKETRWAGTRRAIHRRTQMLCRRDTPRNAFVIPHIRAERGTGSALTADADEFGTACAAGSQRRTQQKRRSKAGVGMIIGNPGPGNLRTSRRRSGRGSEAARRRGLGVSCGLSTMAVCVGYQVSVRSTSAKRRKKQTDQATKQWFAFYSQIFFIARFFCDEKRVVCDLTHCSFDQRCVCITLIP